MNKNAKTGILALLLWASLLTLLVLSFCGERLDSPAGLLRGLSYAVPVLFAGFYILVFLSLKESRLRLLALLAGGAALGMLLGHLRLSGGLTALILAGAAAAYLLVCSRRNFSKLQKALQPLNEAARAYQKDRDGEKMLAALDRCARENPAVSVFKRPDTGVVSFQEHILCEKIQVLGDMGRLDERQALIGQLRRETKRPDLLKWLDEKEAEFSIDQTPAP